MILTYDMSTGTFETVSENSTPETTTLGYSAPGMNVRDLELQLLDISAVMASDNNKLPPELAAMDSEAFLRTMKK